jgi:hypothetical protein
MADEALDLRGFCLSHEHFGRFFRDTPVPPDLDEAERVFLVSSNWHFAFVRWLRDDRASLPSCWAEYPSLLRKRESGLVFGRDFAVEPYDLLPRLTAHFRQQPPRDLVVRFWTRAMPGAGDAPQFFHRAVTVRLAARAAPSDHL